MEVQESAVQKPKTLIDATGKPFIQAEELVERISATIEACGVDYAIGYAAVFGSLEQLKAQYMARVALKVSSQSPGDVLATHEAVGQLAQARAAAQAAELVAAQKAPRGSIEKRLAAKKAPTKAPRPASEKKAAPAARKLKSVK